MAARVTTMRTVRAGLLTASAGATEAGSVRFLHTDMSTALDQARQAAMADARRKAELYAKASDLRLGGVAWITEEPAYAPPLAGSAHRRRRRGHITRPHHGRV